MGRGLRAPLGSGVWLPFFTRGDVGKTHILDRLRAYTSAGFEIPLFAHELPLPTQYECSVLSPFSKNSCSFAGLLACCRSATCARDGWYWTLDGNGNWNSTTTAPWFGGNIASGVDANAYFNKIDITADRTVTLTENMTVGKPLLWRCRHYPAQKWILTRSAAQVLTLQTSAGTPTITVDNTTTTISAVLAGSQGLTKAGAGALVLSGTIRSRGLLRRSRCADAFGTNAMTGIIVNAGTLTLSGANSSLSSVVVNGGTLDIWPRMRLEPIISTLPLPRQS